MTTTIYKYHLADKTKQVIEMPHVVKILTVQIQAGTPTMWVIVAPDDPTRDLVEVLLVGTGWEMSEPGFTHNDYIDTVQELGGLVWHFFARKL